MADLRLLSTAALVVVMLFVASCGSGSRRVEVPRLAGRIVDKRTGEPIESVAVYQFYETQNHSILTDHGVGSRDFRWTMTDTDGRFEFSAHVVAEALRNFVSVYPAPAIILLHRDFGSPNVHAPEDRTEWESIVWEIEPDERTRERLADPGLCSSVCDVEGEAYYHCYEIACGVPFPRRESHR